MVSHAARLEPFLLLVRVGDWWGRKIAPLLAVAYLQLLVQGTSPDRAWGALAALLISASCLAAAAHVLTDSFDVAEDRRAGKRNMLAPLTRWQRGALYAGLCLAGFSPWLFVRLDAPALVWLGLIVAAPILYAVPPLRLKEHGLWGVVADAAMAHGAPTLFVLALFASPHGGNAPGVWLLAFAVGGWAWSYGVRGILLHQMFDVVNDETAGVRTYVVQVGIARTRAYVVRYILPVELAAFGLWLLLVFPVAPLFSIAVVFLTLIDILKVVYVWRQPFDPAPTRQGVYIFPQAVYEIWLPLAGVILLVARDRWYAPIALLHIFLFHRQIALGMHDVRRVVARGLGSLSHRVHRILAPKS